MDRVEAFFHDAPRWRAELALLRGLLRGSGLEETWKWRGPVYTRAGANVATLGPFAEHCVLSFFKGAALADPAGLLELPGPNSRIVRFVRFTDAAQIHDREAEVVALIAEAIRIEDAGIKVDLDHALPDFPEELEQAFDADPALAEAFRALTPGRQRGWLIQFSGAKQSATRTARIDKARGAILAGKGMHDR